MHSVSPQHWLLHFIVTSRELQLTVGDLVEWLGNGRTPWSAYQALISGQLIALDKHPGFRPVGVGETWRSLMAKCVRPPVEWSSWLED